MANDRSNIEDQLLVMDAQDGNVKAMEKLVTRWQKRLWHHAFRLTGDNQAAWDITQQTWLAIIKGLRKLHDPANFKPWAYKITTNKSINWIKKKSTTRQIQTESLGDCPAEAQSDTGITELLDKLSAAKKAVLCLYYFEQLTIPEISLALNIPQGTVKSRLHKARNELKILWQKYYE